MDRDAAAHRRGDAARRHEEETGRIVHVDAGVVRLVAEEERCAQHGDPRDLRRLGARGSLRAELTLDLLERKVPGDRLAEHRELRVRHLCAERVGGNRRRGRHSGRSRVHEQVDGGERATAGGREGEARDVDRRIPADLT